MSNISEQLVNALELIPKEPEYKVGDKIKVKEDKPYTCDGVKRLSQLDPPFVLTVKRISRGGSRSSNNYYYVEENDNCWWNGNIEGLYIEPIPVMSRFELLDL